MDILGALPLELWLRVLKYLTATESIRLRLVSKSYHNLLTSEVVCRSLSYHFIKRKCNAAKKFDSWRLHYENQISRRHSYAFGKPWVTENLPHMGFKSFCPETLYLAGTLESKFDFVQVLDLNTYPAEHVLPPTRTPDSSNIRDVVLLPSFVVVVTLANRGYSWNLETRRVYRFEVPNLGYLYNSIHGSGNLIALVSRDSVIVHDVQAEKESLFKGIGNNTRVCNEVETSWARSAFAISNAEKRAVWLFREAREKSSGSERRVFVIDSLHLETGRVVPEGARSLPHDEPFCEDGLWQFWDTKPSNWHPGPAQRTENAQTRRIVFDPKTRVWTEEAYTIMFPGWITEFPNRDFLSRLITGSDGLGCFIDGSSRPLVWMLDQEPGDRVIRARLLTPIALAGHSVEGTREFRCFGLCDKFLVGRTGKGTVVIRFKGIHDRVGYAIYDMAPFRVPKY